MLIFQNKFQYTQSEMIVDPKLCKPEFFVRRKNPTSIGKLLPKKSQNPEQNQSTLPKEISNIGINTSRLTNWLQKTDLQKPHSNFTYNSEIFNISIGGVERSHSENKNHQQPSEQKKIHQTQRQSEPSLPPITKIQRGQELIDKLNAKKRSYSSMNDKNNKNLYKSAIFSEKKETEEEPVHPYPRLASSRHKQVIYQDQVLEEPESIVQQESTIQNPKQGITIGLQTTMSEIKQILIEGGNEIIMTFIIPQVFMAKLSPNVSSNQLHSLMTKAFKSIDRIPKIVSIKKFINCVVMRDTKSCIIWNFNGKIYFGGWNRNSIMFEGNKHGTGLQWIPEKYIYYGEFENNKKKGYGVMKKVNGEIYVGCWSKNQRNGWGKVYNRNGHLIMDGEFEEGCLIVQRQK